MGKIGVYRKPKSAATGVLSVTAAGTPEALSSDHIFCQKLTIFVDKGNTGSYIYTSLKAAFDKAANEGNAVPKGNQYTYEGVYLDEVYIDADTTADKVYYEYQEQH